MKYKINKHQSGGSFVSIRPVFDTPSTVQNVPVTTGQQQQPKQSSMIDEESNDMLKKGGLTSDYNVFLQELVQLESSPYSFLDPNTSNRAIRMMRGKINEMINNKEIWKNTVTETQRTGAFSEVAIGASNELFYRDDNNNISVVSLSKFKKDPEKYRLLSVGELLNERQSNPNLAFDQNIFDIASNSVGLKQITDHVINLFDTLSDYSNKTERTYGKEDIKKQYQLEGQLLKQANRKPTQSEISGIRQLEEKLSTPGEFIKETLEDKGKGKNLRSALNYIWGTLSPKAQQKLEVSSRINGYSSGHYMLAEMLENYGARSTTSIIEPIKESDVRSGVDNSTSDKSLTTFQLFHNDKLFSPNTEFAFNDPNLSVLFRGAITGVSPIITQKGDIVNNATLGDIMNKANYGNFLETDKVYFGNKKVDQSQLDTIIYDENNSAKVYMPVGRDGSPDYEAFKEFKDIYAVYEANKDSWSKRKAEDYFDKNGYKIKIDEVGGEKVIRDNSQIKPFFVMYGYTNDATGLTDENPFTIKLSKDEEKAILPKLESIWTIGTGKNTINITPNKSFNRERYYRGIVTIPYRQGSHAIVNSMVNQGPKEKIATYGDVQRNLWYSSNQPMNRDYSGQSLLK